MILKSSVAKCVHLDVSQELVVTVEYHAPDISIYNSDQGQAASTDPDMSLFLFQESTTHQSEALLNSLQKARNILDKKVTGTKKSRLPIDREKGTLHFYTGNTAGVLEICQQAFKATPEQPRRIALNITKRLATVQEQLKNTPILAQTDSDTTSAATEEIVPKEHQVSAILTVESSRISLELQRMKDLATDLSLHADHSKKIQQDHHRSSVRLHNAVHYWPIFRILVVIVAGFLQVKLVVDYMKSRHIY